jgi:hydrogenase nickel incorporation protein HypA/HybF
MHELSLMKSLLEQVRHVAREHAATQIKEIRVTLGPLSGVEPLLLESAFASRAFGEIFEGARLTIDTVPLTIQCEACGRSSTLAEFDFHCPQCGSPATEVTAGDAVILQQVVLEQRPE